MKFSKDILSLCQKIVRAAVGIGLEEAGNRLCGPTAWRFIKTALSPVVEELEKRYPKIFNIASDADKAAKDLSKDKMLQQLLKTGFENLKEGQEEILAVLARQNRTLINIGKAVDKGFKEANERRDEAFTHVNHQLEELNLKFELFLKAGRVDIVPSISELSISEIDSRANSYQYDAMRWVVDKKPDIASDRLAQGRELLEVGLKREPNNPVLLSTFGYIEKTQAQVAQLQYDHKKYVVSLEKAAKYFVQALIHDITDIGSLNGMANIYQFSQDWDHAIQFGRLAFQSDPNYGAAAWDLAIALENKIGEVGSTPKLRAELVGIYEHLETIMPKQPAAFSAADLAYVQERLRALK